MNKMQSGIYCIENLINGKMYIGQTKYFEKRRKIHFSKLKRNRHTNSYLQNAFNKYGETNFKFKILEYCECKKDVLTECEQFFVDQYDSEMLYNIRTECVDSNLGVEFSEEAKEKMSKAHIGLKTGKKHPLYGKRHSEETKKKMSENHADFSGEKSNFSKLTRDQIFEVLDLYYNKKEMQKDIAEKYNVDKSTISYICLGRTWKNCYKKFVDENSGISDFLNKKYHRTNLTKKQVFEILDLYHNKKERVKDIVEKYDVSNGTIYNIYLGKTWKSCYQEFMDANPNRINFYNKNPHKAKLTEKQIFKILDLYHNKKEKQKDIAKKHDVDQTTISSICNGKTWKSCYQKFMETQYDG